MTERKTAMYVRQQEGAQERVREIERGRERAKA